MTAFPDIIDYQSELGRTATDYARLIDATSGPDRSAAAYEVALTQHEKLAAAFPGNSRYLNELAWARVTLPIIALHKPEQAVRLATKAVALARDERNFWNTLAVPHSGPATCGTPGPPSRSRSRCERGATYRIGSSWP